MSGKNTLDIHIDKIVIAGILLIISLLFNQDRPWAKQQQEKQITNQITKTICLHKHDWVKKTL